MTALRKGNRKALKAYRRRVYEEARAFHERCVCRLWVTGRTDKLANSGYVMRQRRRRKA